jgi:hypothetical protein
MNRAIMDVRRPTEPGRPRTDGVGHTNGQGALSPRLLDLEAAGVLPRVRVPLPDRRELRKLLFDRADLDRLIDVWKDARWN